MSSSSSSTDSTSLLDKVKAEIASLPKHLSGSSVCQFLGQIYDKEKNMVSLKVPKAAGGSQAVAGSHFSSVAAALAYVEGLVGLSDAEKKQVSDATSAGHPSIKSKLIATVKKVAETIKAANDAHDVTNDTAEAMKLASKAPAKEKKAEVVKKVADVVAPVEAEKAPAKKRKSKDESSPNRTDAQSPVVGEKSPKKRQKKSASDKAQVTAEEIQNVISGSVPSALAGSN